MKRLQFSKEIKVNGLSTCFKYDVTQSAGGGRGRAKLTRRKCVIISYEKLVKLVGFCRYESFQFKHREQIKEALLTNYNYYDDRWTRSIAVGEEHFVKQIKKVLGGKAVGRQSRAAGDCHELRENEIGYNAHFNTQKGNIAPENTYVWDELSCLSEG